jgi:acyl carrier protein
VAELDRQQIETAVRQALSRELGVKIEDITNDRKLIEDLGVDSLAALELIFELEDKTGLEIADKDIMRAKTVGNIIDYVALRLEKSKQKRPD